MKRGKKIGVKVGDRGVCILRTGAINHRSFSTGTAS